MNRLIGIILAAGLLAITGASRASAIESWCTNNPGICVCSKTFQAGAWATPSGLASYKYQPGESVNAKNCGNPNLGTPTPGIVSQSQPDDVAAGFGTLRAIQLGPSTVMALEAAGLLNPYIGQRIGVRYYHFWSSDYRSTSLPGVDGATETAIPCNNDKYIAVGDYLTAYASYFGSSSTSPQLVGVSPTTLRGHWAMIEMYVHVFDKVATTNEYHLTTIPEGVHYTSSEPSRQTLPSDSTYPSAIYMAQNAFIMDRYHPGISGPCLGSWKGMFTAVGHWATNAGQRIPQADEVLAALGQPTGVNAPTNVKACKNPGCVPASLVPLPLLIGAALWLRRRLRRPR